MVRKMINWSKKKVLVTGGRGFLGSYVVDVLREKKAKEIITPSSRSCDLTELSNCKKVVKSVDFVFHLAAHVGGIGLNKEKPAELFYDNLMMGSQLMHEAMKAGVEKFVGLGTICSYPKFTPIPFKERDLWGGYPEEVTAPYGLAKKMLIVQSDTYRRQYGFNSIVVMPTNLYGPRDNFNLNNSHVIAALILKTYLAKKSKAKTLTIWGDGTPTRDFLHVKDAAMGIVLAAEKYDDSIPVNLASENEVSIKQLVALITDIMGYKGDVVWDISKPNGQPRRCVSIDLAKKAFGFKPQVSLEEGLRETIEWFESEYALKMLRESK